MNRKRAAAPQATKLIPENRHLDGRHGITDRADRHVVGKEPPLVAVLGFDHGHDGGTLLNNGVASHAPTYPIINAEQANATSKNAHRKPDDKENNQ